jgi:ABC-2 type transport system permease protein
MSEAGVIHDIGYQRYEGVKLGRGALFGALFVHGIRAAFGLGRSAKAKIFPWLVAGIGLLIAVIDAGVKAKANITLFDYYQFDETMAILIVFFVAIIAPALVSRDLRAGVLPLYFSRPVRAADYVAAKVAALISAVWLLLGVPQLIIFLGSAFTTKTGMKGVWHEAGHLIPGWGYSVLWAVLFSAIGLLVASATGKQAFAAGGIVALFVVTTPIVGVLNILPSNKAHNLSGLASPESLVVGVSTWLRDDPKQGLDIGSFGPIYGIEFVCLVAALLLLLLARYRKVASL